MGASRSGKTPLSLYLGYVGYKTVNVPLVPGIKPPDELFQIERWRIVGLTIDAERLLQIPFAAGENRWACWWKI